MQRALIEDLHQPPRSQVALGNARAREVELRSKGAGMDAAAPGGKAAAWPHALKKSGTGRRGLPC